MTIPDYQTLILPVLRALGAAPSRRLADLVDELAEQFELSELERNELTAGGHQGLFYNRVYWATTYLRRAGLADSVGRGEYQITDRGEEVLAESPSHIDVNFLTRFVDQAELRGSSTRSQVPTPRSPRSIPEPETTSSSSLPSYVYLMQPTLDALRALGGQATIDEIYSHFAKATTLSPDDLAIVHQPGRSLTEIQYRLMWARTYLRTAGLIDQVARGVWTLTDLGARTPTIDPTAIDRDVRRRSKKRTAKPALTRKNRPASRAKQSTGRQGSRNELFRSIARAAGTPLHYTEIHRRALDQLPPDKHYPEHLTYAALYASKSFQLQGEGIFVLTDGSAANAPSPAASRLVHSDGGQVRFLDCPEPLLPNDAHPRAFFDSILVVKRLWDEAPHLSARQIYRHMREWAGLPSLSVENAQPAFDSWYAVGLTPHIDFATQSNAPISLTLIDADDLPAVRTFCLHNLLQRIDAMNDILAALTRAPVPTLATLRNALDQRIPAQPQLLVRLTLLLAFEAVRKEGDVWRITRLGETLLAEYPVAETPLLPDPPATSYPSSSEQSHDYDLLLDGLIDYRVPAPVAPPLDAPPQVALPPIVPLPRALPPVEAAPPAASPRAAMPVYDLPVEHFVATLRDTATSYKYFWLLALLAESGAPSPIPLDRLLARMLAEAAQALAFFDLGRRQNDVLVGLVNHLHQAGLLTQPLLSDHLADYAYHQLQTRSDFGAELQNLARFVPYRFLRPFFAQELKGVPDSQVNRLITARAEASFAESESPCPYRFHTEPEPSVELHPAWATYLRHHEAILRGFLMWQIQDYFQALPAYAPRQTVPPLPALPPVPVVATPNHITPSEPAQPPPLAPVPAPSAADVRQHMYDALVEAVRILFPIVPNPEAVLQRHSWFDKEVLPEIDGRAVTWKGWTATFGPSGGRAQAIYVDQFENCASEEESIKSYGHEFVAAIQGHTDLVVMFVTGFRHMDRDAITNSGFLPRELGSRTLHACMVMPSELFVSTSILHLAAIMAKLVRFQQIMRGRESVSIPPILNEHEASSLPSTQTAPPATPERPTGIKAVLRTLGWRSNS